MEKKSYQSWTIGDEFWEAIKDNIPDRQRDPNKTYKCAPGRGRKPLDKRKVMEGILYVLRTGCLWKAVPKEYGAASSIQKILSRMVGGRRIRNNMESRLV